MTDNFSLLKRLLKFDNEDDFYCVQIIARKKENKNDKSTKTIKDYFISDMKYFNNHEQQIKDLCTFFNARAYIRLSRRSWCKVAYDMNVNLAETLRNRQYKFSKSIFSKTVGRTSSISEPKKIWHIDIDEEDFNDRLMFKKAISNIKDVIDELHATNINKYSRMIDVPTPNGLHVITHPFNIDKFVKDDRIKQLGYGTNDIQKNNPTILFAPF